MSIISLDLLSQDVRVVLAPSVLLKLRVSSLNDAEYLQLVTQDLAQGLSPQEWGERMESWGALTVADRCWQAAGWDAARIQERSRRAKEVWNQRIGGSMKNLSQQLQKPEVRDLLSREEMAAYNTELRDIEISTRKEWYDLAQERLEPLQEQLQSTIATRKQEKEEARVSLLRDRIEVLNQLSHLQPFPSGIEGYRAVERLLAALEQRLSQPEWDMQRAREQLNYARKLCAGEAYNPQTLSRLLGEWVVIESPSMPVMVPPTPELRPQAQPEVQEPEKPAEPEVEARASGGLAQPEAQIQASGPVEEARPPALLNQADLDRQERSDKLLRSGNYQRTVTQNFKQAERFYREALRVWEGNESAAKNLANMLRQQKRIEGAIAILEEGVKHAQEPLPFYNLLTNYCTDSGQFDKAREYAQSALRLVGDARAEIGVLTSLVTLEVKDHDIPKALEYIEAILRLNPYHDDTLQNKKRLQALLAAGATAPTNEPVLESGASGLADLAIEFSSSIELSPLIREDLEACELPKNTSQVLQSGIRDSIRKEAERLYQEARTLNPRLYRERTDGFLQAAKLLMQIVGGEKEGETSAELMRALSNYTGFMGDYLLARGNLDAARDYYLEYVRLYKRDAPTWYPARIANYFQAFGEAQRASLTGLVPYISHSMSHSQIQTTMFQILEKVGQPVDRESGLELARGLLELACASDLIADIIARALKQSAPIQRYFLPLMGMLPGQISLELTRDEPDDVFRQRVQHRHFSIKRQERLLSRLVTNMGEKQNPRQAHEEQNLKQAREDLEHVMSYQDEWNKSDGTYFAKVLELVRGGSDYFAHAGRFQEKEPLANRIIHDAETFRKDLAENPTYLGKAYFARIVYQLKRLMEKDLDEGRQRSLPRLEPSLTNAEWTPGKKGQMRECSIEITNTGENTAQNVKIRLLPSETGDYLLSTELYSIGPIQSGDVGSHIISLPLAEKAASQEAIDLLLRLEYGDRDNRERETLPFRLRLSLRDTLQFIPIEENPYNINRPASGSMFVGREELINKLARTMTHEDYTGAALLYGQKRCGKTSILRNLEKELEKRSSPVGRIVPVYFTMQSVLGTKGTEETKGTKETKKNANPTLSSMFFAIADDIARKCEEAGLKDVPVLELESLEQSRPDALFRKYLQAIRRLPGMRRLVLLIDEFNKLSDFIDRGLVPSDIMQFLKSLIEGEYFSCLICGIDTMPDVLRKYPNELAVAPLRRIGYLSDAAARKLIEDPVSLENGSSRFAPLVVDELLKLTAGNPYYIQIFCQRIVEYINEKKRNQITRSDLDNIVNDLISGTGASDQFTQFDNLTRYRDNKDLDTRETILEGLFLYLLADETRAYADRPSASFKNIYQRVASFVKDAELQNIAEQLEEHEVVERSVSGSDRHYRIVVDFFRRWINKKRPIDTEMLKKFERQIREKADV